MPFVDTEMDQIPWHYPPANIVPQPNYTTLIFFQSSALFVIARDIIDVVCVYWLLFPSKPDVVARNGLTPSAQLDTAQVDAIQNHVTKIE
jgi:hypothetical protein